MAAKKKKAAKKKANSKVGGKRKVTLGAANPIVADVQTPKAVEELTAEECLAELTEMAKTLDFGQEFSLETPLEDLRVAVATGREELTEDTDEEDEDPAGDEEEEEVVDADEELDGDSVDVVTGSRPNIRYVRTFCASEHGEGFLELAKEYVGKHTTTKSPLRLVDSNTVSELIVKWEEIDKKNDDRLTPKNKSIKGKTFAVKMEALAKANEMQGQVFVK